MVRCYIASGLIQGTKQLFKDDLGMGCLDPRSGDRIHAIMAVSALSLARQHRSKSIDALQHYHQAFPSLQIALRDTNDLCSDGLFLTHFLLLVYEVS